MDAEHYWIPRTLDAPNLFFLWEADSALLFMAVVFMFSLMSMFLIGLVMGVIAIKLLARIKEEGGKGLFLRVLYWYTPSDLWFNDDRASHLREFLG